MAARNSYTLDGFPLTNLAGGYFLDSETGLRTIPAKRMASVTYPAMDGYNFLPGAPFVAGGVAVTMNIFGSDHQQFMERVEFIVGLFMQRHKRLMLVHYYDAAQTVARYAQVTCISSTSIDFEHGVKSGKIEFFMEVTGSFWRSGATSDYVSAPLGVGSYVRVLDNLTGGNAPVTDALIRVKGSFAKLELADATTGDTLTINGPLAATEYIIIDCNDWTARLVGYNTWDGGENVDSRVSSNRGMGPMMRLEPSFRFDGTNDPFLKYGIWPYVTNPAGSPTFEVRAKKSYL